MGEEEAGERSHTSFDLPSPIPALKHFTFAFPALTMGDREAAVGEKEDEEMWKQKTSRCANLQMAADPRALHSFGAALQR